MSDAREPVSTVSDRRLLLVHAHPDDESIGTGATMAHYAAEGVRVVLVTCTLGEEGEICVPELAHLSADREDGLGRYRIGELADACRALGVSDHYFLGGAGRYRDSGMMGLPTNDRANCFWQADLDEAAGLLVDIVRDVRPQVMVTYDENGFYGHPDHIQAHRVARRAFDLVGDPSFPAGKGAREPRASEPWQPVKFYHTAIPRSFMEESAEALRETEHAFNAVSPDDVPFGAPDDVVTTEVDARDHLDAKLAAMRAHRTQIQVDGWVFALSNNLPQRAFGREHYVLAAGSRGDGTGRHGWETDLFAGLARTGMREDARG